MFFRICVSYALDDIQGWAGVRVGEKVKREETSVSLWLIHVDVCRNQHNIVKQLSSNYKKLINFFKKEYVPHKNRNSVFTPGF